MFSSWRLSHCHKFNHYAAINQVILISPKDVVLEMKGDMLELMMVYQDIQDKLYDIDRSWQNSLVFHNVKQVTDIGSNFILL